MLDTTHPVCTHRHRPLIPGEPTSNATSSPMRKALVKKGQAPHTAVVGCADSRAPLETLLLGTGITGESADFSAVSYSFLPGWNLQLPTHVYTCSLFIPWSTIFTMRGGEEFPWSNYGAEARIIRSGFQQRRRATSMKLKSRGESEHIRAILLPVDLT